MIGLQVLSRDTDCDEDTNRKQILRKISPEGRGEINDLWNRFLFERRRVVALQSACAHFDSHQSSWKAFRVVCASCWCPWELPDFVLDCDDLVIP